MAKAIIIDQRNTKSQIMDKEVTQLTVAVNNDQVAEYLEDLLNNIEQDFGKPRHVTNIGETNIRSRVFKKQKYGPKFVFIISIVGTKIANEIFNEEIVKFCEEY